ncbi:MAG: uridine kinase [Coriobacteriia bacterium]|nr:uridine kinase [Coriobacteriia bacterium]
MADKSVYVIGITGGTGCGKSKIVDKIVEKYPNDTTVLCMDNYYKEHHDISLEERAKLNYDTPDAIDMGLYIKHVIKLKNWLPVESPIYDFKVHDRLEETKTVQPNKILICEGLFALCDESLLEELDAKIYVQVDADERILRRLRRDVEERGRTVDSVITQYLETVKPMHERYIAPSKTNANLLIPQGGFNKVAVNIIIDHIKPLIEQGVESVNLGDFEEYEDVQLLYEMSEKYRQFYEYDHKEEK